MTYKFVLRRSEWEELVVVRLVFVTVIETE